MHDLRSKEQNKRDEKDSSGKGHISECGIQRSMTGTELLFSRE